MDIREVAPGPVFYAAVFLKGGGQLFDRQVEVSFGHGFVFVKVAEDGQNGQDHGEGSVNAYPASEIEVVRNVHPITY